MKGLLLAVAAAAALAFWTFNARAALPESPQEGLTAVGSAIATTENVYPR